MAILAPAPARHRESRKACFRTFRHIISWRWPRAFPARPRVNAPVRMPSPYVRATSGRCRHPRPASRRVASETVVARATGLVGSHVLTRRSPTNARRGAAPVRRAGRPGLLALQVDFEQLGRSVVLAGRCRDLRARDHHGEGRFARSLPARGPRLCPDAARMAHRHGVRTRSTRPWARIPARGFSTAGSGELERDLQVVLTR